MSTHEDAAAAAATAPEPGPGVLEFAFSILEIEVAGCWLDASWMLVGPWTRRTLPQSPAAGRELNASIRALALGWTP